MKAPNGWISHDLYIWNELDRRGFVSKGFVLEIPDLRHGSERALDSFYQSVRQFLHTFEESTRAQLRWSADSDYREELLAYKRITDDQCKPDSWAAITRNERFSRYWQAMHSGRLRRERLVLFLSKRITTDPPPSANKQFIADCYRRILHQFNEAFEQHRRVIASLLESHGCRVTAMATEDLFRYYATFLNPSYLKRENYDPIRQFKPEETIHQNCWHQGVQGGRNFGFFADGYFHNLVILKRRPQRTRRGLFWALTSLPFLDYAITVNLYPLNVRREIDRTEKSLERVRGDYLAEGKHSLLTAKDVKEQRIRQLAQGDVVPFKYDFVVHVWDASEHGLISKTRQIEAAFSQMEDAQCWTSNISSAATTKNIWFQTWPGWLWGTYDHHADHGLDEWLADLLPLSSTFTGHLEGAEALYDGSNHNVIGVRNFLSGTPQLAVLLGMTRAGKSAFMCDLLSQTDPYYDFTLIVEEGLSYGIWTQAQGSTPTVIHPDGDMTLNYLDTQAAPLTNLQITTAAALVAKMAGYPADEDRRSLRLAQITQYVEQLYADRFEEWISEDASRLDLVARQAMAIAEYKTAYLPVTSTFLEAWTEFQHAASEDERQSLIRRWKPEEVSRFLKSPDTERLVRNTAFAFFRTEDYPTHDMLQQMMLVAPFPEHNRDEINHIATLLAPWNEQRLVCGHSTLSLTGSIAHFDLTYIPESNKQLKELAGFLIANHGRQHIITLPRGKRKRVIFEEVARTLDVPGGEQLVSEFYAQLSKFSTWIISIVQQYSRFQRSGIRPIVFGNAKQFFFTRMNDRRDVEDVARDIELSQAIKEAITRYPLPEHLPPQNKYAALTYYHLGVEEPLCGTIHNRVSPEMLFCSSSTGEDFDERSRRLRKHADVVRGILAETSPPVAA
jgi:type IV secretion system protein TrbE